ncbi:MAG TPA: hypothetical protein VK456_03175 [Xanthobacteraceae bacterium]|nr:hypothetical protein [Xanthobacteraceae bacterium]
MTAFDLPLSLSTGTAIVAAVAACASAVFAFKTSRTARKALALSINAAKLSSPHCSVYLIDAFRFRRGGSVNALYVFCVSIENRSTMQNSVLDAELRIPFVKGELERVAVFRHSTRSEELRNLGLGNALETPTLIPARGAVVANCCFEVPNEVLKNAEFNAYLLRIRYAEGPDSEMEKQVIMDVINAEYLEKKRKKGIPV